MSIGTEVSVVESIEHMAASIRGHLFDLEKELFGEVRVCKTDIAWTSPDGTDDATRLGRAQESLSHTLSALLALLGLAKERNNKE